MVHVCGIGRRVMSCMSCVNSGRGPPFNGRLRREEVNAQTRALLYPSTNGCMRPDPRRGTKTRKARSQVNPSRHSRGISSTTAPCPSEPHRTTMLTLGKWDGCQRTVMPRASSRSVDGVLGEGDSRKTARNPAMNARIARITRRGKERGLLSFLEGREGEETAGPPRSQGVVVSFSFIN